MNIKLLFSMSHEPTLYCLLKLESTIVNFNLAVKSISFLVISLNYLLDRSYTSTYNSMCDMWLENLQYIYYKFMLPTTNTLIFSKPISPSKYLFFISSNLVVYGVAIS